MTMISRKKILLFADWYEPGYRAGGPIRSCVNFVRQMSGDYQVFVFTSDRDLGMATAYENIQADKWVKNKETGHIYYCSPGKLNWQNIRKHLIDIQPDFVYLNSMFSLKFTIYPLLIDRLLPRKSVIILAPRGMLRDSAVQFKPIKKKIFLNCFRWLGFHKYVRFHASDDVEARDSHRYFGAQAKVAQIPNFPAVLGENLPVPEKVSGKLSLIFIGRIHPIKNLDYLLKILREVGSAINLTIVGSLEDGSFWEKCLDIIAKLPPHINVSYIGEKPNQELPSIISAHHIFVLPTKGENFGHAIFEALASGRPALISDQTPWRRLEDARAGWDIPLDQPDLFRRAIEQASAFAQEEFNLWCHSTREYVENYINQLNLKEAYLKLFS